MNNSWPKVKLGEVISHRKEFIRIDDLRTYKRCRVQLYAKGIVLRDLVTGSQLKTKEQQICRSGDFLVAEIDAKVGGYGIVPDELESAIVSSHYFLFEVDRTRLDSNFIGYFIKTPDFFDQVSARGTTNYAAIRPSHVLEYQIPLPPLEEQRRIVAKIDELAAKIEDARRLRQLALEESEALTYSTCQELFGKPDKAVGDIADVTKLAGFEYTEYFSQAVPGNVIVVRAGNVRNRGLDLSNAMTITEEVSDALPRSQLKSGDVLMTFIGAKIGDVTYVRPDHPRLHCGPNVAKMTPHRCISTIYLVKVLQSSLIQHQIEEITKSTAQPSLSMRTIRQMKLPVPSLSEQQEIVAYMDKVQAKVDASKQLQKQTATELDALLLSILDKAFNGEL